MDPTRAEEVDAAITLVVDVQARLAPDPSAQSEFIGLLANFGTGVLNDARTVAARAAALLNAHPDLLARLNRFLGRRQAPPQ
jgi:histone deacetylase complex regulatory component SIN3